MTSFSSPAGIPASSFVLMRLNAQQLPEMAQFLRQPGCSALGVFDNGAFVAHATINHPPAASYAVIGNLVSYNRYDRKKIMPYLVETALMLVKCKHDCTKIYISSPKADRDLLSVFTCYGSDLMIKNVFEPDSSTASPAPLAYR